MVIVMMIVMLILDQDDGVVLMMMDRMIAMIRASTITFSITITVTITMIITITVPVTTTTTNTVIITIMNTVTIAIISTTIITITITIKCNMALQDAGAARSALRLSQGDLGKASIESTCGLRAPLKSLKGSSKGVYKGSIVGIYSIRGLTIRVGLVVL